MKNNSKDNKFHKNVSKGFTLVETLIAIFILTLSITGPIYISSFAFRNTIDSRDNISAQYLAEEVIEVIRNKRDTRVLSSLSWLTSGPGNHITGTADCFNEIGNINNKCILVRDSMGNQYEVSTCSGDCEALYFDPMNDVVYGSRDGLVRSKFTREFYFQKGDTDTSLDNIPNKEVKLVVNIKWKERGRDRVYTLTERLYNIDYVNFFKN